MSNKEFKIKNGAVVNGQLTINTTPSAWSGVSGAVDLAGGGIYSTSTSAGLGLASNGYYAGASNWIRKHAGSMGAISVDAAEIGAWFAPTGVAGASGSMTKYVSITPTNVYSAVSVLASGAIKSNNAADANYSGVGAALFGSGGSPNGRKLGLGMNISFDGTNWRAATDGASSGGTAIMTDYGNGTMRFFTAASTGATQQTFTDAQMNALERMRITNIGNVGIGNMAPSSRLVVTDSSGSATVVIDGKSGAQAGADLVLARSGTHQFLAGQMPFIQFNATDAAYASNNASGIGGVANELTFWRYVSGGWSKTAMFSKEGNLYVGGGSNIYSKIVSDGPILAALDQASSLSGFCGANPNDTFTTDTNKVLSHYGLTWKMFSNYPGGLQAALSGYGGIRFYTQGSCKMHITENSQVLPGTNATMDLGSTAQPWRQIYSAGFKSAKGTPGAGDGTTLGYSFGLDGDTGVFATSGNGTWGASGSEIQVFSDGATCSRTSSTFFIPGADNSIMSGHPSFRWTTVYAVTGAINTSDARVKTTVSALTTSELEAAIELSNEIGTYQFLDAVASKGAAARKHIGLTVQRAIEIMESHGLTAFDYGFICYDEWDAETREVEVDGVMTTEVTNPAGNRFSFRYDELNQFVIRGLNEKQKRLEARIAALEAK